MNPSAYCLFGILQSINAPAVQTDKSCVCIAVSDSQPSILLVRLHSTLKLIQQPQRSEAPRAFICATER